MKLGCNLGCGNIPYSSERDPATAAFAMRWINIDPFIYPGHPDCSWKAEDYEFHQDMMWNIEKYVDKESVDVIHIVHALEHVSYDDAYQTLLACFRVLKSGAILEIEVPDLDKSCALWQETQGLNDRILGLFYGTSGRDGIGHFHQTGFNFKRLSKYLNDIGFRNVQEIMVGMGHGRPEPQYDFRVRAIK